MAGVHHSRDSTTLVPSLLRLVPIMVCQTSHSITFPVESQKGQRRRSRGSGGVSLLHVLHEELFYWDDPKRGGGNKARAISNGFSNFVFSFDSITCKYS